jgi:hypothetical protein
MAVKIPNWLDVTLKVIATLIAIFGVELFRAARRGSKGRARGARARLHRALWRH